MPVISMFFGIIIRMYFYDNKQHHTPHIHAEYSGKEVVLEIPSGKKLAGKIPSKQLKLVRKWIDLYNDELMANWELAVNGYETYKIDPLN